MSVQFKTVVVAVTGTATYHGTADFSSDVDSAEVALRGLNLTKYKDNSLWHYRGPTIIRITNINIKGKEVRFSFEFNFSENSNYEMIGDITFLVIANTK